MNKKKKLYWFVPDGLRADRGVFNIYEWAQNGEMPNLKKIMDLGCRGYSWPAFPGHTPTNFATLMTGTHADVHGITDGPMRMFGYPLNVSLRGGFSSFSKLVSPIWVDLEKSGHVVSLQSVPGSTPPELFNGNTIMGRWGAWGVEFPSMLIQDDSNEDFRKELNLNKRLFSMGKNLIRFEKPGKLNKWSPEVTKKAEYEIDISNWGTPLWAAVVNEEADISSSRILISFDRKKIIAEVKVGSWSDWIPITLNYELKNDYQKDTTKKLKIERELSEISVSTSVKIKPIFLEKEKKFRIRLIYDGLNDFMSSPMRLAQQMREKIGPMTDYPDSYPPQLIYYTEDRNTFIEEADLSLQWHKKVIPFLINDLNSDVVIHSIYTPNQMLTSRWWLPYLDPQSLRFDEISKEERVQRWSEVKSMYQQIDEMIGKIISETEARADEDWYVVLSSDHGALPLHREVRLNNLFAEKGWLRYKYNSEEEAYEIDWKNSKVVFLQMNNIYINPDGLGGPYFRKTTENYIQLRDEVRKLLSELRDPETGIAPLYQIWNYEEADKAKLHKERVGDLIVANVGQYLWSEDVTNDRQVFVKTKKGGYKQGVWPQSQQGMLTPFVIMGPGIKKNCRIGHDINHVDQFATLQKIFSFNSKHKTQGNILNEIFE